MNSLNSSFSDRMTERATTSRLLNNFFILTHTHVTLTNSLPVYPHSCTHKHRHSHILITSHVFYFDLKAKNM